MFARCGHYFAIVFITLLFYLPYLLPGMGLLAGGDFFAFFAPYRVFTSEQLHAGHVPLRTNQLFGGYSVFQDPQFALLYPVNFLYGLLVPNAGTQTALDFYMLINSLVLSVAALFFARSFGLSKLAALTAAVVISFNGFVVIHYTHVNMLQVYTTSLAVAGFLSRYARSGANNYRYVLAAGLMLGCGNLAGHPQSTMYMHYAIAAGVAALALRSWQKTRSIHPSLRIALAGVAAFTIGILLAAVQLIPTAELLRLSTRANVSRAEVMWSALSAPQLPVFFFPGFYEKVPWLQIMAGQSGAPAGINDIAHYWIDPYEGMVTLGLFAAVLGLTGWFHNRRRWMVHILGFGCLFFLGCALGDDFFFYGLLYDYVPGFNLVRVSTRILMLFFPAFGLLVGLGVQALWQREDKIVSASRAAATAVAAVLVVWIDSLVEVPISNWFKVWTSSVYGGTIDPDVAAYINSARAAGHFPYLELQLYLAVALFVLMLLIFWLPFREPRTRLYAALTLGAAELAVYGVGYVRPDHFDPITTVEAESLKSFSNPGTGRALAPGFLEGGGVVNSALYMDTPLANGYSVTVDDWVTAFLPDIMPPWRLGVQRVLLDLWNVTDIVINSRPRPAQIGELTVSLDDWGWTEIGSPAPHAATDAEADVSPRALMPAAFTMDFETTQPIRALHVIAFAGDAASLADGVEIGRVTANASADSTTAALILGRHLSDGRYYDAGRGAATPAHAFARQAFQRYLPINSSHGMRLFDAQLDLATSAPLRSITIEATAPYPASLGVSHVVAILADGSAVVRAPLEMEGFTESPSCSVAFRTLHRDSAPGFIRLVPTAVAGSYRSTANIMWRLFNGQQDPARSVIVDKREFDGAELEKLNAPTPDDLQATATITWSPSHRTASITASSNQSGWLALSYAYDAGWSATANGSPVEIYRANGPFMAIAIPAGDTTIQMTYLPKGFALGAVISALTLLGVIAAFFLSRRRAG